MPLTGVSDHDLLFSRRAQDRPVCPADERGIIKEMQSELGKRREDLDLDEIHLRRVLLKLLSI